MTLAVLLFTQSCETLDPLTRALMNLRRLQFKLEGVRNFRLLGIRLFGKSSLADFTADEGLKLLEGFNSKVLPAELTLDILVLNPNDGTAGSTKTAMVLNSLESRLIIDETPTVYGDIESPVEIPGTGQAMTVPLIMSIDLVEFFGGQGYEKILDLALGIGGKKRDVARIALDAQPRVSTPYGEVVYPGRITIISKGFR